MIIAATAAAAACGTEPGELASVNQAVSAVPAIRFAEIHYDNVGTDAGEAIEVSGPAGADVTGWQVILYNGTGGASYDTKPLSGPIPATCGDRGVLVINYPVNGIQNGSPDGMALIDASGAVVEFLSYEGVFAATNGPANGLTSTDIGASENGTESIGGSLQRSADGTWTKATTNTFGACNDNGGTTPPPPVVASVTVTPATATVVVGATQTFTAAAFDAAQQPITGVTFTWSTSDATIATVNAGGVATGVAAGTATITAVAPNGVSGSASLQVTPASTPGFPDTRFSEIHYDNVGVDAGEAIEIEGPAGTDLTGWTIVLYDGTNSTAYNTTALSGAIPATCGTRGVIVVNYPVNGIQNGSPDGMVLVDAAGHVVEFLSYEGTFTAVGGPADGLVSTDIIAQEPSNTPIGDSLQRDAFNHWSGPSTSTFGACNPAGAPPPANRITFSGRDTTDVPLPVGFQSQLFATELTASNATVTTTFTWSSDTPDIATVDPFGVITALAAGTAVFRATAADGTTGTWPLPTIVAVATTTASYLGNTEFGEPADSDPSDDFIVRHAEYTTDYNPNRGEPNWVSYDLNATDFGPQDRCNCFTFDPDLPASFTHLTTQDYTGAGAAAGFGIDRGHMTRSFDRTSSSLDNAHTFLLSNVVPQASDLNQGPWADFENFLGDLAMTQNKEVRIITGPAGNLGTVKNEGKIVIPASTWKVAVIMDRGHGLTDIRDYRDLQIIAVNMPNMAGIRNVDWHTYLTTVDAIEALTGYDLLAKLPDKVENIVEAGIQPPIAAIDGPYTGSEGGSIAMSAAASVDPNGTVVSYAWNFGDGTTATGPSVTHTYAQDGVYTISVTVTDNDGLTDNIQVSASVANVAPAIAPFAGAMLLPAETYAASGSFTDPGMDPWTATVDYGDGSGPTPLALSGTSFALSHTYRAAGVFTVTVAVSDDHATTAASQTVTVISQAQAVRNVIALVELLSVSGQIPRNIDILLDTQLDVAATALDVHQPIAALAVLDAVLIEIDVFARLRQIPASDAQMLRAAINRIVTSIAATSGIRH
ncbi:MAG TPA: DNA/RNA non-specific endonuclease [Kofleriaceae bacterium]|nr:DNA/RNA non-specific endonuclease [Kofleriaceae bacterium]